MKTEDAVAHGIKATAGVVTSAAMVAVAVFTIVVNLGWLDFKMTGVGLATAIVIDATIIRAVPLSAAMKLLGDWNWHLPNGSNGSRASPPSQPARPHPSRQPAPHPVLPHDRYGQRGQPHDISHSTSTEARRVSRTARRTGKKR